IALDVVREAALVRDGVVVDVGVRGSREAGGEEEGDQRGRELRLHSGHERASVGGIAARIVARARDGEWRARRVCDELWVFRAGLLERGRLDAWDCACPPRKNCQVWASTMRIIGIAPFCTV